MSDLTPDEVGITSYTISQQTFYQRKISTGKENKKRCFYVPMYRSTRTHEWSHLL